MTDDTSPPLVLALTVGGSRAPLETAIDETAPAILLLIASAAGVGSVSSKPEAEAFKTTFETSRAGRQAHIVEIPADDPNRGFSRIVAAIDELRKKHSGGRIVADYTCGTKSMSAALLMAAFQRDLETRITTGRRDDLVKVITGTQTARKIDARLIGVERDLATALCVASQGDYAAAANLLDAIQTRIERGKLNPPRSLNKRLKQAHDWAECLAAWDRFDHKTAWSKLETGLDAGEPWAEALKETDHAAILEDLAQARDEPRLSLCQDLLENACRRERQGRFDDAVARLYRFTEACVQTQLYRRHKLKSNALEKSDLPPELHGRLQPRGQPPRYQTPLRQTVDVLLYKDRKDPVAAAYFSDEQYGPSWLSRRNNSILAHGYSAVRQDVAREAFDWVKRKLIPAMGLAPMPPFPDQPHFG